jgi:penicillin-binding protein 1A
MEQNTSKKHKLWLKIFSFLVFAGLAVAGTMIIMVMIIYPKLPSMNELRDYQPKLPLQVYSSDGVLLGQFGQEHRIFVSFNNTPKLLVEAILAAEDERFYKHGGIDFLGVMRAALTDLVSGHIQSGASTITMQVARNFFLSSQKTFYRKFNEALLAYKIEKSLTKDQILELYINQIYLGQRAYGFAEAALTYFGRPLDKLSIAQYAVLAGLPKAPSAYNPVVNKERSHARELYVLTRMRNLGFITEAQYDLAVKEKIVTVKGSLHDATDSGGYVAEMVRQMLYTKFGEAIYTQGYKAYTTIDSKMQQAAYVSLRNGLLNYDHNHGYNGAEDQLNLGDSNSGDAITDQVIMSAFDGLTDYGDLQAAVVLHADSQHILAQVRNGSTIEFRSKQLDFVRNYLTSGGAKQIMRGSIIRVRNMDGKWSIGQIPAVEGAIVALNPQDGSIKALIGGFDFTKNNFNHVTQAMRQPGSSFKPFIYSAALDKGFGADSIIDDDPVCYATGGDGGGQWCPKNDEGDFLGPITFREALALSRNVVTVKILNQITPAYAIDYVSRFGFDKSQFQPYLSMALGASVVTPLQMAEAYAVFANGGYLVQPYIVSEITNNKGNIIAKTEPNDIHKLQPVIDPRNAYIMNSIMQDVVRYGTGAQAYRVMHRDDMAGKTGTTTDSKDVWFDGYTPDLVAVTWVGYEQPKSLGTHAYGATVALPIWINFMQQALANIPQVKIPMPAGITVKANTSWKGNDEYVYTGESEVNVEDSSSGVVVDESSNVSSSSTLNTNNVTVSVTPINTGSSPSLTTTQSASSGKISPARGTNKAQTIDDIVKNIQD